MLGEEDTEHSTRLVTAPSQLISADALAALLSRVAALEASAAGAGQLGREDLNGLKAGMAKLESKVSQSADMLLGQQDTIAALQGAVASVASKAPATASEASSAAMGALKEEVSTSTEATQHMLLEQQARIEALQGAVEVASVRAQSVATKLSQMDTNAFRESAPTASPAKLASTGGGGPTWQDLDDVILGHVKGLESAMAKTAGAVCLATRPAILSCGSGLQFIAIIAIVLTRSGWPLGGHSPRGDGGAADGLAGAGAIGVTTAAHQQYVRSRGQPSNVGGAGSGGGGGRQKARADN